jgi:transcriptional regulatory protein LevR
MNDYERILNIHLDEDDYVGLMVHMACLVDRLMKNKTPTVNFDSDKIIVKYPQEKRELTKSLEPIEKYFHISFLEGDVATLISIVKR